ncbi:MAG: TIGR03936 family radical SAM-associated protein, partial [bacterium]
DYLKAIPFSADLPWSHIKKGPSVEHLYKERERTSTQMQKYVPYENDDENGNSFEGSMEFGRSKKKVASQNVSAPTKNRLRLKWGRDIRYKFMSHLDNLRALEKAIRRSKIPIAYSQGYNPSMKLSFGPPLSLGITSEAEYIDITLDTNVLPYMIENLQKAIPEGMTIYDARNVIGKAISLTSWLNRAVYTLNLEKETPLADLNNKIKGVLDSKVLELERVGKNKTTLVDIRPAIYELLVEGDILKITIGLGEGGYVRPTEMLEQLFEKEIVPVLANRLHRKELYHIDDHGSKIDPMEL